MVNKIIKKNENQTKTGYSRTKAMKIYAEKVKEQQNKKQNDKKEEAKISLFDACM